MTVMSVNIDIAPGANVLFVAKTLLVFPRTLAFPRL